VHSGQVNASTRKTRFISSAHDYRRCHRKGSASHRSSGHSRSALPAPSTLPSPGRARAATQPSSQSRRWRPYRGSASATSQATGAEETIRPGRCAGAVCQWDLEVDQSSKSPVDESTPSGTSCRWKLGSILVCLLAAACSVTGDGWRPREGLSLQLSPATSPASSQGEARIAAPENDLVVNSTLGSERTLHVQKKKSQEKNRDVKLDLRTTLGTQFSTNPFHYSNSDLDNFDNNKGDGERFDRLESSWDFITTIEVDSTLRFPLSKRKELKVGVAGAFHTYALNTIANYGEFAARAELDITRDDRGSLEVSYTPSRFKKNYKLESSGRFEPAEYRQLELDLGYDRDISKEWSGGISYEFQTREFNPEFDDRDRDGHSFGVHSEVRLTKEWTLEAEAVYGVFDTDTGMSGGIEIDRSFEQFLLASGVGVTLGDWELALRVDYRRREYTTDVVADGGRYNREDDRYGIRFNARVKLPTDGLRLTTFVSWRKNDANPDDPTIPTDETGYEEFVAGFAFRYSF